MAAHFFVAEEHIASDVALLSPEDSRHLVTVMRARVGDAVSISDGRGRVWSGSYRATDSDRAQIGLLDERIVVRSTPSITVVHALPKQRKLDEVVQRLTELGVDRIVPVHSERSQVELDERKAAKSVQRWRAIAVAAAKQSQRAWLPEIDEVGWWPAVFAGHAGGVACWEESTVGLRHVLDSLDQPAELVVAIGPEGGLTADEIDESGLPHASLGPTILRTETAALVAVAAIRYHFGLMEHP